MISVSEIISQVKGMCRRMKKTFDRNSRKNGPGAKARYALTTFVLLSVVKSFTGWSSNAFFKKLRDVHDDSLRKKLGLPVNAIPSREDYNYRTHQECFEKCMRRMFYILRLTLLKHVDTSRVIVDATDIEVKPKYDSTAAWGHCSKGKFYGYKAHILCTKNGIPLAFRVTKANEVEVSQFHELLMEARGLVRSAKKCVYFMLGDAAYDCEGLYEAVDDLLDALLLCSPNWRSCKKEIPEGMALHPSVIEGMVCTEYRKQALLYRASTSGKKVYKGRIVIEQVNSDLKQHMYLNDIHYWQKGIERVKRHVFCSVFNYCLSILINIKHNRAPRHVKSCFV